MRIHNIDLKNIGPFKEAKLEFIQDQDSLERPPVTIITGENGTGKTIILDAIRTLFYGPFASIERDIASTNEFSINCLVSTPEVRNISIFSHNKNEAGRFATNDISFNQLFTPNLDSKFDGTFIVDYWTSKLATDNFKIQSLEAPKTKHYLDHALSGIHTNVELTKLICFFDYLRDSNNEDEKKIGETIYKILKELIEVSITDGELKYVSRTLLQPIISINNVEVSLNKLSSGNLYLIQRFVNLLRQLYAVCINYNVPFSNIQNIPGLLLIDEAENHLHPKWQKTFLNHILNFFPNLQIILTTHSPFIVSSIENARVFVCSSNGDHSVVNEETEYYNNQPIEEILMSPLFNTSNFNVEISDLLKKRKSAIKSNNKELAKKIESQLFDINPEYFNFLKIDDLINSLKDESVK